MSKVCRNDSGRMPAGTIPACFAALLAIALVAGGPMPGNGAAITDRDIARAPEAESGASPTTVSSVRDYGRTPIFFEPNTGRYASSVRYLFRGRGYNLLFLKDKALLTFRSQGAEVPDTNGAEMERISMELVRAHKGVQVRGENKGPTRVHYMMGSDPSNWHTDIPTYAKVRYKGVYPGVDAVFYGAGSGSRALEYDFVVAPGADPGRIRLAFKGADRVLLNEEGGLVLETAGGRMIQRAPVAYQEIDGARRFLEGSYVLHENREVGFKVAGRDPSKPLVIDPILVYSTYLGGRLEDGGNAIAVDDSGSAYITGYTESPEFLSGDFLPHEASSDRTGMNVFVAKLDPTGSQLLYRTYLGGNGDDIGKGIAVDPAGNAYVTGITDSPRGPADPETDDVPNVPDPVVDFPTAPAGNVFQPTNGGAGNPGGAGSDAFVFKLNPTGSRLIYSTYLGGAGFDEGTDITVACDGVAFVTGQTFSPGFPITLDALRNYGGEGDAFVTVLSRAGAALLYSTFWGGDCCDRGFGIAVDRVVRPRTDDICTPFIYVTGDTNSQDFPTTPDVFGSAWKGGYDAFVSCIDPDFMNDVFSAPVYSTFLGGGLTDAGRDIAVDPAGNAYVTGETNSSDFPTLDPLQGLMRGEFDAFAAKLNPDGDALIYSTYLGGSGQDRGLGIDIDADGSAYVAGDTDSEDFPVDPAERTLQLQLADPCCYDAFVTKIDPNGQGPVYSTYLGGTETDRALGIAVDASRSALITGVTFSTDFPLADPFQPDNAGMSDVLVAKICEDREVVGGSGQPRLVNVALDTAAVPEFDLRLSRRAIDGNGAIYLSIEIPRISRDNMWFRPADPLTVPLVGDQDRPALQDEALAPSPYLRLVRNAFGFFPDAGDYPFYEGKLSSTAEDLLFTIGGIDGLAGSYIVFTSWYLEKGLPFNAENLLMIQRVEVDFN